MITREFHELICAALFATVLIGIISSPATEAAPPPICSGETLIAIDPSGAGPGGPFKDGIAYVPIYALDAGGNAQIAVVDLTVGLANPVLRGISLPGSDQPIGLVYNPNNQTVLAEARQSRTDAITIYEIDTLTQSVIHTVAAPGVTQDGFGGGILENLVTNQAFVAGGLGSELPGSGTLGILDISKSPPVWNAASVVPTYYTGSLSLNSNTGILFTSGYGTNSITDTAETPLSPMEFDSSFGITDGNAFDVTTNVMALSNELDGDTIVAFNFKTLNTSGFPATALNVTVPNVCPGGGVGCIAEAAPFGDGPGGETAINCTTHQALVADQFGQNFKLIQLPTAPVAGALDNNGRPGTGTKPDAASVVTVAGGVIPKGLVSGTPTQLGIVGDPNSLTIDPTHNFAYMLADTLPEFHQWPIGGSTPLFLGRVDLSSPVVGSSPIGGVDGKTFWSPASAVIPMPSGPIPTPTPTPTPTGIIVPTPTPVIGGTVSVPSPVATSGVPGGTVGGGVLKVGNVTGVPMTVSTVRIFFDNADLFTTTALTASVGGVTETSRFNPTDSTTNIDYTFSPPLIVPKGQSATFSLSLTITKTPQITMRRTGVVYAGMFDLGAGHSSGLGALSAALMLLSLCTAAVGGSRRRTMIALILLMLAVASQVGCDSGSVPNSSGGAYESTQTAKKVAAANPTGGPIGIGGLPAFMSKITVPQ